MTPICISYTDLGWDVEHTDKSCCALVLIASIPCWTLLHPSTFDWGRSGFIQPVGIGKYYIVKASDGVLFYFLCRRSPYAHEVCEVTWMGKESCQLKRNSTCSSWNIWPKFVFRTHSNFCELHATLLPGMLWFYFERPFISTATAELRTNIAFLLQNKTLINWFNGEIQPSSWNQFL